MGRRVRRWDAPIRWRSHESLLSCLSRHHHSRLRDHYAFPVISDMPVSNIATPDIPKVLTPIWKSKVGTARCVRQRLSTVLEWARAAGFRSGDNPVGLIGDALPRQKKTVLPCLIPEVSIFIGKLRDGQAAPITKLAFEFLILTAVRATEA
jgi:integrase